MFKLLSKTVKIESSAGFGNIFSDTKGISTQAQQQFDKELLLFTKQWATEAQKTYANKINGKAAKILHAEPLRKVNDKLAIAAITVDINATAASRTLVEYPITQTRLAVSNSTQKVNAKGKKIKARLALRVLPKATRTKVLRSSSMKLIVDPITGIKGFYFNEDLRTTSTRFPGKNRADTPAGIFVRSQRATWQQGRRLPTKMMMTAPFAILVNSKRVRSKLDFDKLTATLQGIV